MILCHFVNTFCYIAVQLFYVVKLNDTLQLLFEFVETLVIFE